MGITADGPLSIHLQARAIPRNSRKIL